MIRVTIWNEYVHEREDSKVNAIYPDGIHACISEFLGTNEDIQVRVATLEMPEHGLSEETLANTDVLIWWGHMCHEQVSDSVVERVKTNVLQGMGFIGLHSAHHSKIMKSLLGTSLNLRWRHGDRERVWCVNPAHPISAGVPDHFELEKEEMYGEFFDIPTPDDVIFLGWFSGGEVMRSGCTFTRGRGKMFYFQPGHEEYPIYYHPVVQRIITNAVRFVSPTNRTIEPLGCVNMPPSLEGDTDRR
ncbi:MAG TPA: ThuA domain-containing protein [Lachnospiraceae bacterium]|nr:ThuA domain-containing protein [Lachnospiraceae bacterium]